MPGVFELLGLPMSSAGNGTGAWLDVAASPNAPEPGLPPPPEPDALDDEGAEDDSPATAEAS